MIGKRFGKLVVVSKHEGKTRTRTRDRRQLWSCRCDCGGTRIVSEGYLKPYGKGARTHCGCEGPPKRAEGYGSWRGMLQRCKKDERYKDVPICPRWRSSFKAFIADMGPPPSPAHSLDRIDNDEGYSPDNCRWATRVEQARNTRNIRLVTFRGKTLPMSEWALRMKLDARTIALRLDRGWDVETALTARVLRGWPPTPLSANDAEPPSPPSPPPPPPDLFLPFPSQEADVALEGF